MRCWAIRSPWSATWSTCWSLAGWWTPLPRLARNSPSCRTGWKDASEWEVTTAVALEPAEVERITRFVADLIGREVVVTPRVDEDILGGLVIQIGDRLMDGSARARLNGLRERLNAGIR